MNEPLEAARFMIAFTLIAAGGASAQDLPTTQMADHAQVMRQDTLTRSLLRQNRNGHSSRRPTAAQSRACATKQRFRSQLGADHPKVMQLYGLCRRVGL